MRRRARLAPWAFALLFPTTAFAEDAPPPPVPAAPANVIVQIAKRHNRPQTDGRMALELSVDFVVRGEKGRDVKVAASFSDRRTGARLRSVLASHADAGGSLVAATRPVRVEQDGARYRAILVVPYAAFPALPGAGSYEVDARVDLLRVEPGGATTSLAAAGTGFTVHGSPPAGP